MPQIVLGKVYKDSITGFYGVATSRTQYLHGSTRIALEATSIDNKPSETAYVDEERLEAKEA